MKRPRAPATDRLRRLREVTIRAQRRTRRIETLRAEHKMRGGLLKARLCLLQLSRWRLHAVVRRRLSLAVTFVQPLAGVKMMFMTRPLMCLKACNLKPKNRPLLVFPKRAPSSRMRRTRPCRNWWHKGIGLLSIRYRRAA